LVGGVSCHRYSRPCYLSWYQEKDGGEHNAKECKRCRKRKDGTDTLANGEIIVYSHPTTTCDDYFLSAARKVPYPLPHGPPLRTFLNAKVDKHLETINENACEHAFRIAEENLSKASTPEQRVRWQNLMEFRWLVTVIVGAQPVYEFNNRSLGIQQ
jgi:hypothetical protein